MAFQYIYLLILEIYNQCFAMKITFYICILILSIVLLKSKLLDSLLVKLILKMFARECYILFKHKLMIGIAIPI